MSEVAEMLQRYKEIRNRLRHPPNAVSDPEAKISKLQQALLPPPCPVRRPRQPVAVPFKSPFLRKDVTFCNVLASVAYDYGMNVQDLFKVNRKKQFCIPRWVAFYLTLKHSSITICDIEHRIKLDHGSIRHGIKRVKEMIALSPEFAAKIEIIEENILARFYKAAVPAIDE